VSAARRQAPTTTGRDVVRFDPKKAAGTLRDLVGERQDQIAALLGAVMTSPQGQAIYERFVTISLDAIVSDKRLIQADPLSLIAAIRRSAMLGLEPSPALGDGAIVAYRDRDSGKLIASFQPMYRGLAKLSRRHPDVRSIDWQIVFENDYFEYRVGVDVVIDHRPALDGNPGAIRGAYAFGRMSDGSVIPQYLSIAQILKVRDQASREWRENGESSLWGRWPEQMALKTVVKRLMTKLPLDPLAAEVLAEDNSVDTPPTVSTPRPKQLTGLRSRLGVAELEAGDEDADGVTDGSGDDASDELATDAAPASDDAQGPSGAATEATDGQVVELCDDTNPYDDDEPEEDRGGPCAEPKGHKSGKTHGGHKAKNGATW
jgi:phage RecT family recombinase